MGGSVARYAPRVSPEFPFFTRLFPNCLDFAPSGAVSTFKPGRGHADKQVRQRSCCTKPGLRARKACPPGPRIRSSRLIATACKRRLAWERVLRRAARSADGARAWAPGACDRARDHRGTDRDLAPGADGPGDGA